MALALSDTIAIVSWRKAERSKVDFGVGFYVDLMMNEFSWTSCYKSYIYMINIYIYYIVI